MSTLEEFIFTNTKVDHGDLGDSFSPTREISDEEVPYDPINIQIPSASHFDRITRNVYYEYIPLSQAISQGRLAAVKEFLDQRPNAVDDWINVYETPLLKACTYGNLEIVKEILRRMTPEQMLSKMSQNSSYHTPLTVVAVSGNMEIAKALVAKNPKLVEIPGINGLIPVVVAVENKRREMARYLYTRTPVQVLLDDDEYHATLLFLNAIYYKMLDIALDLFNISRRLAFIKHPKIESVPVIVLASKPELFPSGCNLRQPLQRLIYPWIRVKLPTLLKPPILVNEGQHSQFFRIHNLLKKSLVTLIGKLLKHLDDIWTEIDEVYQLKVMHLQAKKLLSKISEETLALDMKERSETLDDALFFAVRYGNVDFLVEMIKNNSELLRSNRANSSSTLFHLAVEFRQEKVFSLLYGMGDTKYMFLIDKDNKGNTLLHLAGYAPPNFKLDTVVSATMQMQRELQWFKEIDRIIPEIEKERMNREGKTPIQIFRKEHEPMRQEAEKWMKDTATSCSLIATIIVTVTFAAIFTVPGGTDDNAHGRPFHVHERKFVIFIVSDLISCFAACTSILIFFGILSSRYSFDDFLFFLPAKMIAGLSILFISMAAMLVAFSMALLTTLDGSLIVHLTILLSCFPALLFILLQYDLLKELIYSTFGSGIFDRNMKSWFLL